MNLLPFTANRLWRHCGTNPPPNEAWYLDEQCTNPVLALKASAKGYEAKLQQYSVKVDSRRYIWVKMG